MNESDEDVPYRVQSADNLFQVVDSSAQVLVACVDASNAGQYAALLNQAYRRGFKAGYRKGRLSAG